MREKDSAEDVLRIVTETEGVDYGVIKPGFGGRWNWPLTIMEPGDYFHVAYEDKSTGNLRHLVSVRAAQSGKYFSVRKDSPMLGGHTIVICTPPPEMREAIKGMSGTLSYELAQRKLHEHYASIDLNDGKGVHWGTLEQWEVHFSPAIQIKEPVQKRWVFDGPMFPVGMEFEDDGVRFRQLPRGANAAQWEVMFDRWNEQWLEFRRKWEEARDQREAESAARHKGVEPIALYELAAENMRKNAIKDIMS